MAELIKLLRHRPVQLLLAVAQIVSDLQGNAVCDYFSQRFPRDLIQETATAAKEHPEVFNKSRLARRQTLCEPRGCEHSTYVASICIRKLRIRSGTRWRQAFSMPPAMAGRRSPAAIQSWPGRIWIMSCGLAFPWREWTSAVPTSVKLIFAGLTWKEPRP